MGSEMGKSRAVRWSWGHLVLNASAPNPADWKILSVDVDPTDRSILLIGLRHDDDRRIASAIICNDKVRAQVLQRLKREAIGRGMDEILKWEVPRAP